MREHTLEEFNSNIARAKNLVAVYESLKKHRKGRRTVGETDVLRAAVVFTHSSIEELFRNLFKWKLPTEAPVSVLDKIPIVGSKSKDPEKFLLGGLADFRHEWVENVIVKSIDAYCDVLNINSSSELAKALGMIGIETKPFDSHLSKLEALFTRRHQIVHQADKNTVRKSGKHKANSLSVDQVQTWIRSSEEFVSFLLSAIPENVNRRVNHDIRERAKQRRTEP